MAGKLNGTTFIGKCNFRGNEKIFGIKTKDRRQHMYVIGKTGVGKTALLKNIALQDIRAGRGVGIIDPHGEFVEEVLSQVPAERMNDVVYFNPVDMEYPIGFNIIEVPDPKYKHLVVSDLLGIFTKIWANVWSARMEYILQNCIMALLDTPGTTLLGIPRILVDKDYRQKIVANVKDPVVRSFWMHEYEQWRDQFRNEAIVPIQNKVNQFLNTPFIRNIVGQSQSTLNIPEIMNEGKILLVNVSKGRIGEDNSALLGAMIITKVQLAAMERVRILEEDRRDFYLYVDEFQNFATDSFASILSEARKYRLSIIIAHQYVGQLITDVSTKVRDAVFGNVGTMIAFRVGAADAEFLEQEFSPEFMQQDLLSLANYNIYLKLMVDGVTSRPFSAVTIPPLQFETDPTVKEKIIKVSRGRYARPRVEVEEKIARWSGMGGEEGSSGLSSGDEGKTFDTICWNCGKTATVPFRPDGKRPVYCLTCLKQIEEGKLIPLPERMPQVGKARFGQTLGGIGIEFSAREGAAPSGANHSGGLEPRPFGRAAREGEGAVAMPRTGERREGAAGFEGRRFGQERGTRPFLPRKPEERLPSRPGIRSQPMVKESRGERPVSLTELKPRVDTKREASPDRGRKTPDSSELRRVLEESLDGEKSKRPEEGREDRKKEGRVIRPGESVRF